MVQGKNPKTATQKYNNLRTDEMSADEDKQLRHKCMRNTGLYITWLDKSDLVLNIDEFTGHSAGSTAMYLAAKLGVDEIFLLGFDLSTIDKPLSNVYLWKDYHIGFDSTTWQNQMKTVMRKFKNVKFTWVSPMLYFAGLKGAKYSEEMTKLKMEVNKVIEKYTEGEAK